MPYLGYGVAVLSVTAMTLLRFLLVNLWKDKFAFLLFFPAVLVTALYGGLGPGLLAILLSALAAAFFFLYPEFSLVVHDPEDFAGLLGFCVVCLMMVLIADGQRKAQRRAEQSGDEIQRANAALRESEQRLSFALDAARMGTWEWDVATDKLTWSPQLEPIHGMVPGTFDGTFDSYLRVIHPEDREVTQTAIANALESGTEFTTEFRVTYPDGSIHWVAGEGSVIRDESGKPIRMAGVGMDVTARKVAEMELRTRAARESVLNRIGEVIRNSNNPEEIQWAAVSALGEALAAERCCFVSLDPAVEVATIGRDWHRPDLPPIEGRYRLRVFQIDVDLLFPKKGSYVVSDIRSSKLGEVTVAALEQMRIRSTVSVGLFGDNGRMIGSLNVSMADTPREWTTDEIALVEAVATQLRSAVEAARLREREHRIAERLQEALLPHAVTPPGTHVDKYYLPALDEASIGGDFLDIFPLDDDARRYALVVADLSGKGLDAAAQVATVRHMLRTMLYISPSVAEAVQNLNRLLSRHGLLAGFATVFAGTYDCETRRLTYVSCGQEPGLLYRAETGDIEQLPPTGPVLGAHEGAVYEESIWVLKPGDILTLFTDGLTEARLSRKVFVGIEGVADLLREAIATVPTTEQGHDARELVEELMARIQARTKGKIVDDVCLLIMMVQVENISGNKPIPVTEEIR